jgi:neutral amino acid transport system permease protein
LRRAVIAFTAFLGGLIFLLASGATAAWAEDEGLRGTLQNQGQPVNGVKISVATEDGQPVGEATTGADGTWEIPLPGPGTYKVTIDQSTLPPDVELRFKERATLTLPVFEDQKRTALFALVPKGEGGEGGGAAAAQTSASSSRSRPWACR